MSSLKETCGTLKRQKIIPENKNIKEVLCHYCASINNVSTYTKEFSCNWCHKKNANYYYRLYAKII